MSTGATETTDTGWGQQAVEDVYGGGGGFEDVDGYDAGDIEPSQVGGVIEVEGAYHMEIKSAKLDEKLNRNGRRQITVMLVALHSTPGLSPAGSAMWHHLELPSQDDRNQQTKNGGTMFEAMMGALCTFCESVGVFKKQKMTDGKERYIDPATGSTKLQISSLAERLTGLQVIGRPTKRLWTDRKTGAPVINEKTGQQGFSMEFTWGRGCSLISAPENAHVPINETAASAAGWKKAIAAAPAAGATTAPATSAKKQSQAQPQQPKQATIPGTVAPADPYADL